MRNATLVLACRDLDKGARAAQKLLTVATSPVNVLKLDLDDPASIEGFNAAFRKKFDRLDILVNNAGVMACPFNLTRKSFVTITVSSS